MNAPAFIAKEVKAMEAVTGMERSGQVQHGTASAPTIIDDPEAAFKNILECEAELSAAIAELHKAETIFGNAAAAARKKLDDAWAHMEGHMQSTGEYEILVPGDKWGIYRIHYTTPRLSVKVTDVEALPEDLVKIEKKPKLREIGERLKEGWATNAATLSYGEKKLTYKFERNRL